MVFTRNGLSLNRPRLALAANTVASQAKKREIRRRNGCHSRKTHPYGFDAETSLFARLKWAVEINDFTL
jgi:hypothetical protein